MKWPCQILVVSYMATKLSPLLMKDKICGAVLKNQNLFVYTIQLHLSALPWITYRKMSFRDEKFDNLIFKVPEKKHVPNGLVETVGPELLNDLCPVDLRFDTFAKNFRPNELKIYKVLKKKWSKWQDRFNLY